MAEERLDIIIFGATGFTGKHTVKYAAQLCKEKDLKFGVSGRRKEALETVVKQFAGDYENVPIVIADLKNEDSLKAMTQQAKVLVNCCGPYRFYGEPVVKACIATKTHYVDVTGEPEFMEKTQLEYSKPALEAGIFVVTACGFDSIPCDMGVIFTQSKFQGEVNSIETYVKMENTGPVTGGPVIHYGTWESAIYGVANAGILRPLRTRLYPEKLPEFTPKQKRRSILHKNPMSGEWSTVFPSCDRSVALRTQRFLFDKMKQRPAQVQTYVSFGSLLAVIQVLVIGMIFGIMSKFEIGRTLLLKYPGLFSAGKVSHDGPKEEVMDKTKFTLTFKADGWTEKLAEPTDKHTNPPNKEMITKVTGYNPGYGSTCVAVLLAAITILEEGDKIPTKGVLTPGMAFCKTSLIEELNKNGIKFEVVSSIEK